MKEQLIKETVSTWGIGGLDVCKLDGQTITQRKYRNLLARLSSADKRRVRAVPAIAA